MSWNRRPLNHPFIFSLQPRAADRSIWLGGGDRLLSEKAHTSGDERPNSAPIIPLALKHPDVPRAQRTWTTAFLHNELHEYLNDVPDKRKPLPFEQQVKEAFSQASLHRTIDSSNKIILTVEQGASFIVVYVSGHNYDLHRVHTLIHFFTLSGFVGLPLQPHARTDPSTTSSMEPWSGLPTP